MSHHHLNALGLHLGLVAPIVGHRHLRVHGFDSSREQKWDGFCGPSLVFYWWTNTCNMGSCEKIVCTRGFGI